MNSFTDHAFLSYPGMASTEEVEVQGPVVEDPQYVDFTWVRYLGADEVVKVHNSRLSGHYNITEYEA